LLIIILFKAIEDLRDYFFSVVAKSLIQLISLLDPKGRALWMDSNYFYLCQINPFLVDICLHSVEVQMKNILSNE
jgi:hypothetical protein